jgi:hypothetical protein
MTERKAALDLLRELETLGCDPVSIARDAKYIHKLCLSGVFTEKVSNRVEDGVVQLKEVYPDVALKALTIMRQAYQDALKQQELELLTATGATDNSFVITVSRAVADG